MNRFLVLALLVSIALLPGAQNPGDDVPPRTTPACDYVLLPQTDSGGCYSAGNPVCLPQTPPCCQHYHQPLNWNKAVHWFKTTGRTKGPKTKRFYQAVDSRCTGTTCMAGGMVDDSVHYQTEDTLVGCVPE